VKKKHLPPQRQTPARYVAPGMTAFGISSSRLGDLVELALAEQLGWVPLVGALAGTQRQGAFDLQAPDGTWCEVKAVTVFASEYKVKPTAKDLADKVKWARDAGKATATVMVIVRADRVGMIYRREGLGCFRMGMNGLNWNYVGKVKI